MNKTILWTIGVIAVGAGIFVYSTRPVATPTTDVQTATQNEELPTPVVAGDEQVKQYRIAQDKSQAQFSIKEELSGKPFTAVGTTNQVAGDVVITQKADGTPGMQLGKITVDARTFKTDSPQRDGAINRMILKTTTPGNEYVTFSAKTVSGLPSKIESGKPFAFTVAGDLTVSGVTKPATIAVTATQTDTLFSGTMKATVKRSDYGLTIPNIPFVANVSDSFDISGTFSAPVVK